MNAECDCRECRCWGCGEVAPGGVCTRRHAGLRNRSAWRLNVSEIETVEMECRYCGERFSEPKRRKQRCYCPPHRHARYRMAVLSADGGRAPRVRRPEPAFEEDRAPNRVECERCGDVFSAFGLGYHRQVCSPPEFREPPAVAKVPPPTHCPRCSARLLGNHGERYCFVHGTFDHIPRPPGPDDLVADEEEGPRPQGGRTVRLRMILCETCGEVFSALGIANHRIACERDAAVAS